MSGELVHDRTIVARLAAKLVPPMQRSVPTLVFAMDALLVVLAACGGAEPGAGPEPPLAAANALVVRALGPGGEPLAGSRAMAWEGSETGPLVTTGADGRALLPPLHLAGNVLVQPPGRLPQILAAPAGTGEIEARWPAGRSVSGRVQVDGRTPPAGTMIRLRSGPPPLSRDAVPSAVWTAFGPEDRPDWESTAPSDAAGRFRFDGLPTDWKGVIVVPSGSRLLRDAESRLPDSDQLVLLGPVDDLELHAVSVPVLRGRLLEPGGGRAVAVARIDLFLSYAGEGAGVRAARARSQSDGRFEVAIPDGEVVALRFSVSAPGVSPWEFDLPQASLAKGSDLGEIELPDSRRVRLVVVDASQRPIDKARAALVGSDDWSEPGNQRGRVSLEAPRRKAVRLQVRAPGYEPAEVEVPTPNLKAVQVTLQTAGG